MKYIWVVLIALPILVACGTTSPPPITEAQLCADLQTFQGTINDLKNTNATTIAEIRISMSKVSTAWDAVRRDVAALHPAELATIEAAYHDLNTALTQMPDNTPKADAKAVIGERTASVEAAWTQLFASVNCS